MKLKLNTDIAALIVAFTALTMAGIDGYEQRRHNRKSVMPVLISDRVRNNSDEERSVEYNIHNSGMGPAAVKEFHVFFNKRVEKPFSIPGYSTAYNRHISAARHVVETLNDHGDGQWRLDVADQGLSSNTYIPANKSLTLLRFDTNIPQKEFRDVVSILERTLDIFICYCSIYDDQCQWTHIGQHRELITQQCSAEKNMPI